jgi:environmental stress-induced protein Ves
MKLYTQDIFKTLPWKNGGGVTQELLLKPRVSDYNLRLSVAKVEGNGPFSFFPGYNRHLLILDGTGINLTIEGQCRKITKEDDELFFPGEASVFATLLVGPVTDFNVMINRTWGKASVKKVEAGQPLLCAHDYLYIFSFENMELRELIYGEEYTPRVNSITVSIKLFNS